MSRPRTAPFLLFASCAYFAASLPLIILARHSINPDGVAYIQVARHYARGDLSLAFNSYWSPLYSWILSPFVLARFDPVLTAKALGAVLGWLFALGTARLTAAMTGGRGAAGSFIIASLLALNMFPVVVSPDLLLSAILTWYFLLTLRSLDNDSPALAFGAGLLGGIAYLAKTFALPFVLAHLFATAALRLLTSGGRMSRRSALRLLLPALAGFAILVIPWVSAISTGPSGFTVGTAGRISRAWAFYGEDQPPLPLEDIALPAAGRISSWENPDEIDGEWPLWSPFDGAGGLKKFGVMLFKNVYKASWHVAGSDYFGLLFLSTCAAFVLLFPVSRITESRDSAKRLWAVGSALIYLGGYAVVINILDVRYLWPLFGLFTALAVQTCGGMVHVEPVRRGHERSPASPPPPLRRFLAGALLFALTLSVGLQFLADLRELRDPAGELARQDRIHSSARQVDLPAPLASNVWNLGLYFSFWRDTPFLGSFHSRKAEDVLAELRPFGKAGILVFDDRELAEDLARFGDVEFVRFFKGAGEESLAVLAFNPGML